MATDIHPPTTYEAAISVAYLGADLQMDGCSCLHVWVDDSAIGFTLRFQVNGGSQVEMTIGAGNVFSINMPRATDLVFNCKSASGTPNVQVLAV